MPTIDHHAQTAAPLAVGIAAIVSGVFTPEFIVTFLCAVLGSGIGMAYMPAPAPITSRIDLASRFIGNVLWVFLCAIIIMFAMHYLQKYIGGSVYALAFFAAMFFMLFRERLFTAIGKIIDRKSGEV